MSTLRASLPTVSALGAGLVFGVGLALAGMTDPAKVQAFLDVTGGSRWDPSLALVMVGAIAVHAALGWLIRRRAAPLFVRRFALPTRTDLDPKLIGGAALFGVGWGMGGICPGPGLVDLGSGIVPALVFVIAMAAGMTLQRFLMPEKAAGPQPPQTTPQTTPTTTHGALS